MFDVAFVYTRGLPDFVGFFANDDDDDVDMRNLSQYGRGFAAVWTSHTSVAESLPLVDDGVADERYLHAFIGDVRIGGKQPIRGMILWIPPV